MKASRVFGCDYTDKDAVVNLAKEMGEGMTVFKHPDRPNYNITHTIRFNIYEPEKYSICEIIFRT